jgi:RNA polymerase sigma factor (sigma-70 family)
VHDSPAGLLPDAQLVEAALDGDKDAFAALVTRHWATAVALAARVLGTADLAADAAQEAAVAALVGLDRLRAPGRFGAWFCGITLNVARGWVRQLRAERPAAALDQAPDRASAEPGPDERAELADLAATVRAAVAQLAGGQRDAVLLFYLQGLTHREVAAELAISRPLTYQLAAGLLGACDSRISEVRITRLTGVVFYAVVVVDGPAGHREVDARPSDAVNLALVTGAPILADSALLDDPRANGRDEWRDYPSRTAALAAEARQWMRQLQAPFSAEVGPGRKGEVEH